MSPHQQSLSRAARRDEPLAAPLVFIDADNTLWDTDGVFAEAQLSLLAAVEKTTGLAGPVEDRLEFVRTFDQQLAQQHHLGLRYPPRLLVDALALGLQGMPYGEAVRQAWTRGDASGVDRSVVAQIESDFIRDVSKQPALLAGVAEGLRELTSIGAVSVVFTEGSRKRILRSVESHKLNDFIDRIFEAPKTARMFERVRNLAREGQPIYVIGDQLSRDIQPAKDAGIPTIFIPGRFQPRWEALSKTTADYNVSTFDRAASLIAHLSDGERVQNIDRRR